MSNLGSSDRYSAARQITAPAQHKNMRPDVASFIHAPSHSISHVVYDRATRLAAIIDPVLDFDPLTLKTSTVSADKIITLAKAEGLAVEWILETHVHDDRMTAARYMKERLGAKIGTGAGVAQVQEAWNERLNLTGETRAELSAFDHVFEDGEEFAIGRLMVKTMHTPGHTPACVSFLAGDAVFCGDTLFMADCGTASTNFPGGDPRTLYHSIRKLLALPPATRLFLCHDPLPRNGRSQHRWETTVSEQAHNVHLAGVSEDAFVALRETRDESAGVPPLLYHAVQVNIRAGVAPPPEDNGVSYLKLPIF
jgi:glyoxylase-like metal-dependent hydrolase (beta-lactamase superfamily II)